MSNCTHAMYEQQSAFYNRPKNCVNNGFAIRCSAFLVHRENPSYTHINALWLYALHSSIVGLSDFSQCARESSFQRDKSAGNGVTLLRILSGLLYNPGSALYNPDSQKAVRTVI